MSAKKAPFSGLEDLPPGLELDELWLRSPRTSALYWARLRHAGFGIASGQSSVDALSSVRLA
jgi:hypothetical protein